MMCMIQSYLNIMMCMIQCYHDVYDSKLSWRVWFKVIMMCMIQSYDSKFSWCVWFKVIVMCMIQSYHDVYDSKLSWCVWFNNFIWYVLLFLIGWKIASISVLMKKKTSKPHPLLELLFVVTASTQSKLIGTNSSSHKIKFTLFCCFK